MGESIRESAVYLAWRERLLQQHGKQLRTRGASYMAHRAHLLQLPRLAAPSKEGAIAAVQATRAPIDDLASSSSTGSNGEIDAPTSASATPTRLSADTTRCEPSRTSSSSSSSSTTADGSSPSKPSKKKVNDAYAFTGMHTIWCEHIEPVTSVRFANHDNSLLAFAAMDGDLSVCYTLPEPRVHKRIKAHSEGVADIAWSMTNDMLLTASFDASAKVWNPDTGACVRTVTGDCAFLSCLFHPLNSNTFFLGNDKSKLKVYNLSTGQCFCEFGLYGAVTAIAMDSQGTTLFAGDAKGYVHSFGFDQRTNKLLKQTYTTVSKGKAITSLQYKAWFSSNQMPELLANCQDNTIKLFNVLKGGALRQKREFPIKNATQTIRSCFCPLISQLDGACIVSGSEDMNIKIYDEVREDSPCVNELMGHSGSVLDVSWNYDESLLASCDDTGAVIVWKRVTRIE